MGLCHQKAGNCLLVIMELYWWSHKYIFENKLNAASYLIPILKINLNARISKGCPAFKNVPPSSSAVKSWEYCCSGENSFMELGRA